MLILAKSHEHTSPILTVIFVFSLVLIAYSYAANRVSEAFRKRSSGKILSVASGGAMILAGIAVAFSTNR